jgi:hypothetical protein
MRRLIVSIALLLPLAGCVLPKLPTLADVRETVVPISNGDSARQAAVLAAPEADKWAAGAKLLMVRGTNIDGGGRNGGLRNGVWLLEYQAEGKDQRLAVRVAEGKVSNVSEGAKLEGEEALDRGLAGLLDSNEAVDKGGLGAKNYTIVLRNTPQGPRYDLVGEGSTNAVTVDARTGQKI